MKFLVDECLSPDRTLRSSAVTEKGSVAVADIYLSYLLQCRHHVRMIHQNVDQRLLFDHDRLAGATSQSRAPPPASDSQRAALSLVLLRRGDKGMAIAEKLRGRPSPPGRQNSKQSCGKLP